MSNSSELIEALNQVAKEKGIDKEVIFEAIETSLISACKKNFGTSQNVRVDMDRKTGVVKVYAQRTVSEEVSDPNLHISVQEARKKDINYEIGDIVETEVTPKNFGRISAQTAKQVVVQKFREAERDILFNEYVAKEREVITGIIQHSEKKNIVVALGKIDAFLPTNEQMPGEIYRFNDRKKLYVLEVKRSSKGPIINLSRTHPELVKRLFEQESPEIHDGIVEIKSVAREPGSRTKIAVFSKNPDVDAIGACVGHNGYRVNVVVSELNGEKIDVILWDSDPRKYIVSALSPSRILAISVNTEARTARVLVPDNQLSLVIGKEGQNVRLAARLTGFKIDIKSESNGASLMSPQDYLFTNEKPEPTPFNKFNEADEDEYEEVFDEDENGEAEFDESAYSDLNESEYSDMSDYEADQSDEEDYEHEDDNEEGAEDDSEVDEDLVGVSDLDENYEN